MNDNFSRCLSLVLIHEGGYSNNPNDPGGATMKDITQRTYDAWRVRYGMVKQDVRKIADHEIAAIYLNDFWRPCGGDRLPDGLDYAVFDYAVNSGVSRAVKALQGVVGATQDGILGENTLAATRRFTVGNVIFYLCHQRMDFLRGLPTWPSFKNGWTARVIGNMDGVQADDVGVIDRATAMAKGTPVVQPPVQISPASKAIAPVPPIKMIPHYP